MEGKHIDPTRSPRIADLHLSFDEPTRSLQASGHECDALGVGSITYPVRAGDDRRLDTEDKRRPKHSTQRISVRNGQPEERPVLDAGRPTLRSAEPLPELCLCQADTNANLRHNEAKRHQPLSKTHEQVIPDRPYPGLT
jgi:hypothetical protein